MKKESMSIVRPVVMEEDRDYNNNNNNNNNKTTTTTTPLPPHLASSRVTSEGHTCP